MLRNRNFKRTGTVRFLSCVVLALALFNFAVFIGLLPDPKDDSTGERVFSSNNTNDVRRALAISSDSCEWSNVNKPKDAPQDTDLFATLVAGFPGSGKRLAFMQLEGMTELRASDDYNITGGSDNTKFAFKKTNYPHHDGIWDWGKQMKQVILVVRNPRWALPSYHHLLYEIEYSDNWTMSFLHQNNSYTKRPPIVDWLAWREARFDVEIKRWGWFIDFWMEGGLVRDMFTNELTTPDHFSRLKQPTMYASPELIAEQESLSGVTGTLDEHCVQDLNCNPVAIISYERMIDETAGPSEIERFVAMIDGKLPVVEKGARECVWRQMIVEGNTFAKSNRDRDQEGPAHDEFKFTLPQMEKIQSELERVKTKYSTGEWLNNGIAQSLVGYIDDYLLSNAAEMSILQVS